VASTTPAEPFLLPMDLRALRSAISRHRACRPSWRGDFAEPSFWRAARR
jgi:hypothetical protein